MYLTSLNTSGSFCTGFTPIASHYLRASGLMSKAFTSKPFFTRLPVIGNPILPNPTNPTFYTTFTLQHH